MHHKLALMKSSLVNWKGPILLHENAQLHVSRMTSRKLFELGLHYIYFPFSTHGYFKVGKG